MVTTKRIVLALVAAALVAPAAYAFTASNTVPATTAGTGQGAVTGYTASGITYALDATTPTDVDSVSFSIAPTTGVVKVQLYPAGSWYSCVNTAGAVSCATTSPQLTAANITQLVVVAAQ